MEAFQVATSTITLRSSYGTLTEAQKNIVLTCVTRIVLAYRSYMTLVLGGATSIRSVKPTQHRRDREKCFMKKVKLGKRDYAVLNDYDKDKARFLRLQIFLLYY